LLCFPQRLKGLEGAVSFSATHPTWQRTRPDDEGDEHCGWVFRKSTDAPLTNSNGVGSFPSDELCGDGDQIEGCASIRDIYELGGDKGGKYTTPVLWDKVNKVIVNNESTEILRIFNSQFQSLCTHPEVDLYPAELEKEVSLGRREERVEGGGIDVGMNEWTGVEVPWSACLLQCYDGQKRSRRLDAVLFP